MSLLLDCKNSIFKAAINPAYMNIKIQFLAASAIACFTSGCVLPPPYYSERVDYGRPVAIVPDEEIILPRVIIVEHGVRHDRAFYRRHPEYYHRDRMRHPELFRPEYHHDRAPVYRAPVAPSYRAPIVVAPVYHGPVAAPHAAARPNGPADQHPNDPKAKKKHDDKNRDDKDHDDHNR
ncbi:MAG: hypothetical protein WCO68_10685 [Verrucomicrobiota bacterium]